MSNSKSDGPELKGLPEPEVRTKKQRISIVWLVPLIALAVGGWLVYKAISEKGPIVTITFKVGLGVGGRQDQDQVQGCRSWPGRFHRVEQGSLTGDRKGRVGQRI